MSTLNTDQYREHPTINQGRYVILSCLGVGGMGAVFHAYDQRLKVYRAIKVLKPELVSRPEVRQRFTREAVSMAQLTHPHIVQIFDYGQEALTLYIVMEYISGNSLQAHLDKTGALSVEYALMKYIHQKDLIHRDIKSAQPKKAWLSHRWRSAVITSLPSGKCDSASLTRRAPPPKLIPTII